MILSFLLLTRRPPFATPSDTLFPHTPLFRSPHMRCANTHASRGSRPFRISSMPRHIWAEDQALVTRPPSTSTSTRRWPSMRLMGSITTRVMWLSGSGVCGSPRGRMQHGELLDEDQVQQNLQRGDTQDRKSDV